MKRKTAELQGAALDWAVAKCEKFERWYFNSFDERVLIGFAEEIFSPSHNWAQAGPIIERENIALRPSHMQGWWEAYVADSDLDMDNDCHVEGPAPLIAAMRCYVAFKLGDEVDIPDELENQA